MLDSMPRDYDRDLWSYWYPRKEGVIEPELFRFIELLGHQPQGSSQKRVLDLGCGEGRHLIYLAKNTPYEIYGFDFSPRAIEVARQGLQKENLSADLRVHDMNDPLDYPSNFFIGIVSTGVIGHATSTQVKKIALEIDRVLKSGGLLFLMVASHERELENIEMLGGMNQVKFIDSKTHVPLAGPEKGVPHYHFTREDLFGQLFPNFEPEVFHQGTEHFRGICYIGRKK